MRRFPFAARTRAINADLAARVALLELQNEKMRRALYGQRAERGHLLVDQLELAYSKRCWRGTMYARTWPKSGSSPTGSSRSRTESRSSRPWDEVAAGGRGGADRHQCHRGTGDEGALFRYDDDPTVFAANDDVYSRLKKEGTRRLVTVPGPEPLSRYPSGGGHLAGEG